MSSFEASGFLIINDLISADDLPRLRAEVDRLLDESPHRGGVRNVLDKSPYLHELATCGPPSRAAETLLGPGARPVKLTIFDKTPHANWKVPWHQDLTISVQERRDVPGFGPWSIKDGVPHVQPPVAVLEQMIAVRVHLDDTPAGNGALRVLPGTHKLGRLSERQIALLRRADARSRLRRARRRRNAHEPAPPPRLERLEVARASPRAALRAQRRAPAGRSCMGVMPAILREIKRGIS